MDKAKAHFELGKKLFDQGRYQEAEVEFRAALELNPDFIHAYTYLGLSLSGQGKDAEGKKKMHEGWVKFNLIDQGRLEEARSYTAEMVAEIDDVKGERLVELAVEEVLNDQKLFLLYQGDSHVWLDGSLLVVMKKLNEKHKLVPPYCLDSWQHFGFLMWARNLFRDKMSQRAEMVKDKEGSKSIWQRFEGQPNSKEILFEKASFLAPVLVAAIPGGSKDLFGMWNDDEKGEVASDKFGEVSLEMALFFIHYVDRNAFNILESDKRVLFMDALTENVATFLLLQNKGKVDPGLFRSEFIEQLNERQREYSKYKKWFPGEEIKSAKDTLFWEFGKRIANMLGFKMSFKVIFKVHAYVISACKAFELKQLLG